MHPYLLLLLLLFILSFSLLWMWLLFMYKSNLCPRDFICRYGNANVWKTFTDLFDYFPLTALVSVIFNICLNYLWFLYFLERKAIKFIFLCYLEDLCLLCLKGLKDRKRNWIVNMFWLKFVATDGVKSWEDCSHSELLIVVISPTQMSWQCSL